MLKILQRRIVFPTVKSSFTTFTPIRFKSFTPFPNLEKMSQHAIVKHFEGEPRFTFSFHLVLPEHRIDKQFNLNRDLKEETASFLERLTNNVNKANKVKGTQVNLKFMDGNSTVIESCDKYKTIQDFLFIENLQLNIDKLIFNVIVNPPLVRELKVSENILTDLMIYPYSLIVDFADESRTKLDWFVSSKISEDLIPAPQKKSKTDYSKLELSWTKLGEGFSVVPTSAHINCLVKVVATPASQAGVRGEPSSLVIGQPVSAGPGRTPAMERQVRRWRRLGTGTMMMYCQEWTREVLGADSGQLRVTSYNILADLYADSDYSRTVLFAQCPPYALALDYRLKLLVSELLGYNSDLVTLQECDRKVFTRDLGPVLDRAGISGQFAKKGGQVDEGLATFYRRDKFRLLNFQSVFLPTALTTDPCYGYILERVQDNPKLMASLTNRTTTVSVAVLEHRHSGNILLVANTHLYFEPNADHIRLIQTEMCRVELEKVRARTVAEFPERRVAAIFCGDFNSTPPFGVVQLLTTGHVAAEHADWRSQEGEEVAGLRLEHEPVFVSAAGTPRYTNYTLGFKDCLDYVWVERGQLEVAQVVPFPSEEELALHSAIPSIVFPSDHVPIIVDLKFKD